MGGVDGLSVVLISLYINSYFSSVNLYTLKCFIYVEVVLSPEVQIKVRRRT